MNNTPTNMIGKEMDSAAFMIGLAVMLCALLLSCSLSVWLFSFNAVEQQAMGMMMLLVGIPLLSGLGALLTAVIMYMNKIDLTECDELNALFDVALF
jgi:ABC-type transport system involved in cytochrome c biogenesis permease component